ncbi:EamA-like transporter family protein [Rhodovulum sp. ES.010]|uniref:EamA family transporter n=1 Tax=Rhodovulum sp. ES.010 TaxID=1882821 RepID=UPI000928816B|nr:EamA family transporter [Rhodovulum sp. ES.010]SIO34605.1 EamA-like transporter family protein [Rhodovulum sp. ES.010]
MRALRGSSAYEGIIWCLIFVVLDACQAVYLGAYLQEIDSFLLGGLVFGSAAVLCLCWSAIRTPQQLRLAGTEWKDVLGLNLTVTFGWLLYFFGVQLIEPAVAFTLFSGAIPVATVALSYLGVAEAEAPRNRSEWIGLGIITTALVFLAGITLLGFSGFVRGGETAAISGLIASFVGGVFITGMLLYGQRLHRKGLGPTTQFGLRFPLFLVVTFAGYMLGLDAKGPVAWQDLLVAYAFGMLLLAFPIYAVQKAISLTTSLTIAAVASTAPLLIFVLQMIEGRVDVSLLTSAGLIVFFAGSLVSLSGAATAISKPDTDRKAAP